MVLSPLLVRNQSLEPALTSDFGGSDESVSPHFLYSQLLEASETPGPLSQLLMTGRVSNLREGLGSLLPAMREALAERVGGRSGLAELVAISEEPDAELANQRLFRMAQRLESSEDPSFSLAVYQYLSAENPTEPNIGRPFQGRLPAEPEPQQGAALVGGRGLRPRSGLKSPPYINREAARRMAAITGENARTWDRIGYMGTTLARQIFDGPALLGMVGAGLTFKVGRLALGRGLGALGVRGTLQRGLATAGAFVMESTAFPLITNVAGEAMGRHQDWSSEALRRQIIGSHFVLGGLKLFGGLAGRLAQGAIRRGLARPGGAFQVLAGQGGMYFGTVAGHVGEHLYLGEGPIHWDQTLATSLVTLVHFNAAGGIIRIATPRSLQQMERFLEQAPVGGRFIGPGRDESRHYNWGPQLATAGEAPTGRSGMDLIRGAQTLHMDSAGPEGPGGTNTRGGSIPAAAPLAVETARGALDRFAELPPPDPTLAGDHAPIIPERAQILRTLRENPEATREALIGRRDLSPAHLDLLAEFLGPESQPLVNPDIQRVLIPNRGEIALRIARTLQQMGITPVGVHSEADAGLSWVRRFQEHFGGEMIPLEGKLGTETYVNIDRVIQAIQEGGVQAIHPGYGNLSEVVEFAERLEQEDLVLIGPSPRSMLRAGNKDVGKEFFQRAGVPVVLGTRRGYSEVEPLIAELKELGLVVNGELTRPIRLKAVAGGGGRGQATIFTIEQLRRRFPLKSAEARTSFSNPNLLAELYVPRFLHIERQILADRFGNVIDLGERECTLQENDQKIVEIHPAPAELYGRFPELNQRLQEAAVRAARAVDYVGHGTVEFMVDPVSGDIFALEINTRIQVERGVTELVIPGLDLIREATEIAMGLPLTIRQSEVRPQGAAMEVRLKAWNTETNQPARGRITRFQIGGISDFESLRAEGIHVDATYLEGDTLNSFADPSLALIKVVGSNYAEARDRMEAVLAATRIEGTSLTETQTQEGFATDLARNLRLIRTSFVRERSYDNHSVNRWGERGGEDFSSFPQRRARFLDGGDGIHLEIGSQQRLPQQSADKIARAMQRLVRGQENSRSFRLTGPLAQLLRTQPEIRALLRGEAEGNGRRVWAQADAEGQLRQIILFQGERPVRVLMAREVRVPQNLRSYSGRERTPTTTAVPPLEPAQDLVYDLDLERDHGFSPRARIYLHRGSQMQSLLETPNEGPGSRNYDTFVSRDLDRRRVDLFPVGDTDLRLQLRFITREGRSPMEIRDRDGNVLVSIAPQEIIRNQAERLTHLLELARSRDLPRSSRSRATRQIEEILEELAELPNDQDFEIARQNFFAAEGAFVQSRDRVSREAQEELWEEIQEEFEVGRSQPPPPVRSSRLEEAALRGALETHRAHLERTRQGHELRQRLIEQLGHSPTSMVRELMARLGEDISPRMRRLLDEIVAFREIEGYQQRHALSQYRGIDEYSSLVTFLEETPHDILSRAMVRMEERAAGDFGQRLQNLRNSAEAGESEPNQLVPILATHFLADLIYLAEHQLSEFRAEHSQMQDNVLQIVLRSPELMEGDYIQEALNQIAEGRRVLSGASNPNQLKRITFVLAEAGEYPRYLTYRPELDETGAPTGRFTEDLRYRDIHPMLGHHLELRRLNGFQIERDTDRSDRLYHLFNALHPHGPRDRRGNLLDQRLFGLGLVPEVQVQRTQDGTLQGLPQLDRALGEMVSRMENSLRDGNRRHQPHWNRIFLNVQPVLEVSFRELNDYVEGMANRMRPRLDALNLEKVMLKMRIRDSRAPDGIRTVLLKVWNPSLSHYVVKGRNVAQVNVHMGNRFEDNGQITLSVRRREVILNDSQYERWLKEPRFVFNENSFAPADIPIRPMDSLALRMQSAWRQHQIFPYHIPRLLGLGLQRTFPGARLRWSEYDLDPATMRIDEQTEQLDYEVGRLRRVRRPIGENNAGVVVGMMTVKRPGLEAQHMVTLFGDVTHRSRGALTPQECGRIIAAIRLANERGVPVQWFAASPGAGIDMVRGSENLDAIAAVAREIVHSQVPVNFVMPGSISIGGMSYFIALGTMHGDVAGWNLGTADAVMALTGHVALEGAIVPSHHPENLRAAAERRFGRGREGLQTLSSLRDIHGRNGEGMVLANSFGDMADKFWLLHHYTYPETGPERATRDFNDPVDRDITTLPTGVDRTVADELAGFRANGRGDMAAVVEGLRDRGSPPPLGIYENVKPFPALSVPRGGIPPMYSSRIVLQEIGGRSTLVVQLPRGPIYPSDSRIIATAIEKADRMGLDVLMVGSAVGYGADAQSMFDLQLTWGSNVVRAISRHQGPMTLLITGISAGGADVSFNARLNPRMRVIYLEDTRKQVIGGGSAYAAVPAMTRQMVRAAEDAELLGELEGQLRGLPASANLRERIGLEAQILAVRLYQEARQFRQTHPGEWGEGAIAELHHMFNSHQGALAEAVTDFIQRGLDDLEAERGSPLAGEERTQARERIRSEMVGYLRWAQEGLAELSTEGPGPELFSELVNAHRRQVVAHRHAVLAREYDAQHGADRALRIGSIHEVITGPGIRPRVIANQRESRLIARAMREESELMQNALSVMEMEENPHRIRPLIRRIVALRSRQQPDRDETEIRREVVAELRENFLRRWEEALEAEDPDGGSGGPGGVPPAPGGGLGGATPAQGSSSRAAAAGRATLPRSRGLRPSQAVPLISTLSQAAQDLVYRHVIRLAQEGIAEGAQLQGLALYRTHAELNQQLQTGSQQERAELGPLRQELLQTVSEAEGDPRWTDELHFYREAMADYSLEGVLARLETLPFPLPGQVFRLERQLLGHDPNEAVPSTQARFLGYALGNLARSQYQVLLMRAREEGLWDWGQLPLNRERVEDHFARMQELAGQNRAQLRLNPATLEQLRRIERLMALNLGEWGSLHPLYEGFQETFFAPLLAEGAQARDLWRGLQRLARQMEEQLQARTRHPSSIPPRLAATEPPLFPARDPQIHLEAPMELLMRAPRVVQETAFGDLEALPHPFYSHPHQWVGYRLAEAVAAERAEDVRTPVLLALRRGLLEQGATPENLEVTADWIRRAMPLMLTNHRARFDGILHWYHERLGELSQDILESQLERLPRRAEIRRDPDIPLPQELSEAERQVFRQGFGQGLLLRGMYQEALVWALEQGVVSPEELPLAETFTRPLQGAGETLRGDPEFGLAEIREIRANEALIHHFSEDWGELHPFLLGFHQAFPEFAQEAESARGIHHLGQLVFEYLRREGEFD